VHSTKQIGTINRVFTPGDAEVAYAERVVAAFAEAEAGAAPRYSSTANFIDYPILYRAQRGLQRMAALRAEEKER
jgi:citrate lyase subunit beta / citryl-CoA lyase